MSAAVIKYGDVEVLPPSTVSADLASTIPQDQLEAQVATMNEIRARLAGIGEPPRLGFIITLADIQRAITQARLGEVFWVFGLFRDMVENDPHLQAEIGKRIMSFMGQEEKIEPVNKNSVDDKIACEVIEDMIANCPNWREGCLHLAQGHIWPIAIAEKVYKRIEPEEVGNFRHPVTFKLAKLHPVPWPLLTYKVAYYNVNMAGNTPESGYLPQSVFTNSGAMPINQNPGHSAFNSNSLGNNYNPALVWNPNDWHADLRFYNTFSNGLIDWTMATCYKPDPVRHVIHRASVATSSMRDNYLGVLGSLVPIWFYKKSLMDWFMRNMERYGGPFAVAYAQVNNKNIQDILTKAFDQATKINALLVPNGTKIDLKEIQVTGMADGFAKAIDVMNTEETKAILGQTLSTTSKGSGMMGGSGVADLHGEVRSEWCQYDKRAFANMQKAQIFDDYLRVNGYKGRCRSVRGGLTPIQLEQFASTLQKSAQAGIFVDDSAEEDLTGIYGVPMRVKTDMLQNRNGNTPNKPAGKED